MRITLVCLGNICRSPTAATVLAEQAAAAGLDWTITSAGTASWHVGKPMDHRSARTLSEHGYDPSRHRAQQFDPDWYDTHDLVLAMDSDNLADLRALPGGNQAYDRATLRRYRDFDPTGAGDVPDPYYGDADGFEAVLAMVERTTDALLDRFGNGIDSLSSSDSRETS
ncbi:MAG: low molecular weight phosphotyrosine protein phosphatase [Nocardioidaceae bacterium]|nr:MAG: low molecular weight phosphotyrosine protein phosphatase [Nocardioidaceae bacterium]